MPFHTGILDALACCLGQVCPDDVHQHTAQTCLGQYRLYRPRS